MPRFSLQRLVRCALYAACCLMACHVVYLLNRAAIDSAVVTSSAALLGGGGGDPTRPAVGVDEETSPAGRRRIASIRAISPELLHRIGRPMPHQHQASFPTAASLSSASPLLLTRAPFNFTTEPLAPVYSLDGMNNSAVQAAMLLINAEQDLLNGELYGSAITEVIVVQVHDRIDYLYLLVDSLRRVKDIEDCLLVFSHDVYSAAVNALVRSIRFARVQQVFYPYAKQIYYDRFPGSDPRDCPRDAGLAGARRAGCVNAEWPDSYGHYREAKYTQTKHHWLYKMRYVFERARLLANFTGQVVFLEEDHYVVEDLLHVLRLMEEAKQSLYQDVEILTLATYEKRPDFTRDTAQAVVDKWVSSFHNMGMAFTREIWNKMRPCLRQFCEFDDYNWDWSLNHILSSCVQRPFQTMVVRVSPRVFHIGECGVHHRKKVCSPTLLTSKLDKMLADNIAHLYPDRLSFNAKLKIRARSLKPNGGWGDRRDRELCVSFVNASQAPPVGLPSGM